MIGKHVLIGLTYLDNNDEVIRKEQKHGLIVSADDEGVNVRLSKSREEIWLPPHREAYEEAAEGEYRLRATGEVVVDPDLLCKWTVRPGPSR